MATKEDTLIIVMNMVAQTRPDFFSLKDGDFYFVNGWRLPAWLVLAMSDELTYIAELHEQPVETSKVEAA